MFDIGMTEMLVIAVVTIIVVGPKDLPGMLRNIGKYVGQLRSLAREFQGQMDSALKEAELDGVKSTLDDIRNMNPVNQVKNEVSSYMDSARQFDEPDETEAPAKKEEAINSGVPSKPSKSGVEKTESKKSSSTSESANAAQPKATAKQDSSETASSFDESERKAKAKAG